MKNIEGIILKALHNLSDEIPQLKTANLETRLYLDSLALVSLISDLESILSEEFNKEIILADEKMMSSRNSPFKDVKTLAEFIEKKLQEQ
ncbi:hypothetical protein A9460_01395 [Campylobacter volucris]|uniref:Carrier domain-containing protein n=3 Tax=Campylobacter volucris TaxID=1031542 RepID=A0AAE5YIN5_9BACT|nr:hypothetical protein [Campylobacter volucris]AJC94598.1 hypothetical protein CVOL_1303 [Campylobacter volucris LMG 24379]MBF7047666.1 hypothetical protein [Campylobacter volucris]QBL13054.1 hypothetical protein A9460_01395 [Campylobacter volucris]QEL08815.1 hypothetical protein CVOLT_1308 [Campylobacter volucris]